MAFDEIKQTDSVDFLRTEMESLQKYFDSKSAAIKQRLGELATRQNEEGERAAEMIVEMDGDAPFVVYQEPTPAEMEAARAQRTF